MLNSIFVTSSCMFLDKKTLLEIWLNPGWNHLSSNWAQFLTLLTMGASFLHNDKALWIAKPVVLHIEEQVMSLSVLNYCICTFLCCSHIFKPSVCHLSPFLPSCPVCCFFKALLELFLNDLWIPIIWVVWVISYGWWIVFYLLANSIQLQQALKLVHPNIPRNCWSPVGVEFRELTWPWNRYKRPGEMVTNIQYCILYCKMGCRWWKLFTH